MIAALVCDSMIVGQKFIRQTDVAQEDASTTGIEAAQVRTTMEKLFAEGHIFNTEADGTITQKVMKSMQEARILEYQRDGHTRALQTGWPSMDTELDAELRAAAVQLHDVFLAHFDAAFPLWEESNMFGALDVTCDMDAGVRKSTLHSLATRLGLDPDAVWTQIGGDTFPASGMLARAQFFASPAGSLCQASMNVDKKKIVLRDPHRPNLLAWLSTLREMSGRQTTARASAAELVAFLLVFMTQSSSVERFLGIVALTELKHRAHKLNVVHLGDAVKLVVSDMAGRRAPGQTLDPMKLLVHTHPDGSWRATQYCVRAQNIYREFFGERALQSRSLAIDTKKKHVVAMVPPLGRVIRAKTDVRAMSQRLAAHTASLSTIIHKPSAAPCSSGTTPSTTADTTGRRCAGDEGQDTRNRAITAAGSDAKDAMCKAQKKDNECKTKDKKHKKDKDKKDKDKKEKHKKHKDKKEKHEKHKEKKENHEKDKDKPTPAPDTPASALCAAPKTKRTIDDVIAQQGALLDAKRRAFDAALPGKPVPYVMPCGSAFKKAGDAGEASGGRPPPPAPPLHRHWGVSVLFSRGVTATLGRMFVAAKSIVDAEAVAVEDTAKQWLSADALAARLHGKRLVDAAWLASCTKKGTCVAFQPWIHIARTRLWLSAAFEAEHRDYVAVLRTAQICAPGRGHKKKKKEGPDKAFCLMGGPMPDLASKSRSMFVVVTDAEQKTMAWSKIVLTLPGLVARVTALYGPERSVA